jgi:nucleotide-binding universal stress UspA family protein
MAAPFGRLLLATEHTEFDVGAEALAIALARHCGLPLAAVLPVVSNAEFEAVAPQLALRADTEASQHGQALEALARAREVPLDVVVRRGPDPAVEIVEEARRREADLIVIRRRGKRGFLARLLVGEMVGKVVAQAPCSVLVAPRQAQMWTRRVMVALDPQAPNHATLALAAGIAVECGQPLRVVCVASDAAAAERAGRVLAALQHKASAICPAVDGEVRIGSAGSELMRAAKACQADLLVIARQRGDRAQRAGIGGTAHEVIGGADCPVLVDAGAPYRAQEPT